MKIILNSLIVQYILNQIIFDCIMLNLDGKYCMNFVTLSRWNKNSDCVALNNYSAKAVLPVKF